MTRSWIGNTREIAEQALGEEAFQATWHEGETTLFEETLVEALAMLDEVSPPEDVMP